MPQNNLTLMALLEAAFTNGENEDKVNSGGLSSEGNNGQTETDSQAAAYSGIWWNPDNPRFSVSIDCVDGESYFIEIQMASSMTAEAWEILHWSLIGTFNSETGVIEYIGSMQTELH